MRTGRFTTDLQEFSYPPKQRPAYAALQVIGGLKADDDCYAFLANLVQRRVADPAALRDAISAHARLRRRQLLLAMIDDLETGACSVLERTYLHRVERAHGLPNQFGRLPTMPAESAPGGMSSTRAMGSSWNSTAARSMTLRMPETAIAGATSPRWSNATSRQSESPTARPSEMPARPLERSRRFSRKAAGPGP